MIAITIQLDPEFDVTPVSTEVDREERFQNNWDQLLDFFQMCVDQQLCLNLCRIESEPDPSGWHVATTYFAVDDAQADKFIEAFTDMSADFSISKLWNEISHQLIVTKTPVDVDLGDSVIYLVDREFRTIWGTSY